MLILVLVGMYFDAVVVFVTSQTLLFRLTLAYWPYCDRLANHTMLRLDATQKKR